MALRKINTRTILKKSEEAKFLRLVKGWTKHSPAQEEPLDGEPCYLTDVLAVLDCDKCDRIFEIPSRQVICVTMKKSPVWFEVSLRNIEEARQKNQPKRDYLFGGEGRSS